MNNTILQGFHDKNERHLNTENIIQILKIVRLMNA